VPLMQRFGGQAGGASGRGAGSQQPEGSQPKRSPYSKEELEAAYRWGVGLMATPLAAAPDAACFWHASHPQGPLPPCARG
jgi:hypothetical protein